MKSRTCLSQRIPTLTVACVIAILTGCSNAAQVTPPTDPSAGRIAPTANRNLGDEGWLADFRGGSRRKRRSRDMSQRAPRH
jgi:hypothetical protein